MHLILVTSFNSGMCWGKKLCLLLISNVSENIKGMEADLSQKMLLEVHYITLNRIILYYKYLCFTCVQCGHMQQIAITCSSFSVFVCCFSITVLCCSCFFVVVVLIYAMLWGCDTMEQI